jgi:hypothetical protein
MKKTRLIQLIIIIFALSSFSCQKNDLKKDGYLIYKANDEKTTFNECLWWTESYMADSIPVNINNIFAIQRKDQEGIALNMQADHVNIVFDGITTGTFSTPVWMDQPHAFYIEIVYKGVRYSMFSTDQNTHPYDVQMIIDTYDVNEGKIEGSISGTFYDDFGGNSIEVTHCEFCAKNKK